VFDVQPDSDTTANVAQARALLREVDSGSGALVLTDAFGASPGNVAAQLAEAGRVAVIAGVNLPMLLRALCYREGSLAEATRRRWPARPGRDAGGLDRGPAPGREAGTGR